MHSMPMMSHEPITLGAAFLIGLLGAGHCLGMCGGIVNALSMASADSGKSRYGILAGYNLGRLSSYTFIGFVMGLFGWWLSKNGVVAFGLRTLAGAILILSGLYIGGFWNGLLKIEKLGQGLWKYIEPVTRKLMPVKSPVHAFALGLLWGWLPCGLIYSTAIWASMSGSAAQSSLLMLSFGIGTLPAIVATGLAAQKLSSVLNNKQFQKWSGGLLVVFGIWTLPFVGMKLAMMWS